MAIVLKNAYVGITDGTLKDISAYCSSVSIDVSKDDIEDTTFGAGAKTRTAGLSDGSVTIELFDKFGSADIDAITWSVFNAGTNVDMKVRMDSGAVSATNPEYRFTVCPTSYTVGGAVGEAASKSLTYPISGPVVRATSA